MKCRHCIESLTNTFIDLGFAPPSNAYLENKDLQRPEKYFPLKVMVCDKCWLVQTLDYTNAADLFQEDYAYFSSTSSSFLDHASKYCKNIIKELGLTKNSFVIEVASNDGYLLKNFVEEEISCLGVEPTHSTADEAEKIGAHIITVPYSILEKVSFANMNLSKLSLETVKTFYKDAKSANYNLD